MRAKPGGKSDADRKTLEHVQQATKAEIERYRNYDSAQQVVINFKRDLSSDAAKKVHSQLRRLHLPTIEDIRDDFEDKAASSESKPRRDGPGHWTRDDIGQDRQVLKSSCSDNRSIPTAIMLVAACAARQAEHDQRQTDHNVRRDRGGSTAGKYER